MFFTSAIVAQSHYQGKTHAKRVRLVLGEPTNLPAAMSSPTNTGISHLLSLGLILATWSNPHIQPCTVGCLSPTALEWDTLTMITAVAECKFGDKENRVLKWFFELAGSCLCVFGPDLKVKAWQVQSVSVLTINRYSNDQPCQPWLINTCIGFQSWCLHTEPVLTTTKSYYLSL